MAPQPELFLLRGVATRLLVQSQEPNLRAAAVTAIQRLGKVASSSDLDWLILLCETASADGDTIVRRGGFEFSLRILHRLPDIFSRSAITFDGQGGGDTDLHMLRCKLVAVVQRLVEDPIASVRHAVAAHCASLCTLLGGGRLGEMGSTWIVNTLHTFLRDDDGAVRAAAIDAVPFIVTLMRGFAHRYVYHTHFPLSPNPDGAERGLGGAVHAGTSPSNNVVPWSEVEALVRDCYVKSPPSDALVSMAVASMKKTASMLLPALLRLSTDATDDVRCKVAAVVGRLLGQVRDEFTILNLGNGAKDDASSARRSAYKALRSDLTQELIGPLLLSLMKDGHRPVVGTLFSEMAGLPTTYTSLEPEGGAGVGRRANRPMSSVFPYCAELVHAPGLSQSSVRSLGAPLPSPRLWTSVGVMPEPLFLKIVEALEGLTKHRDWRSRAMAVRGVPSLAPFATSTALQERLAQVSVALMRDKVNSVRVAAAEALCLTSLIQNQPSQPGGSAALERGAVADWNEAIVIPQLYNLMQRSSARERQIALYMIQILVSLGAATPDVTIGVLVPLLLNASQDVVSNVRLAVAKSLNFFMRTATGADGRSEDRVGLVSVLAGHVELQRCLERLSDDEDYDVNVHARQAKATFMALLPKSSEASHSGEVHLQALAAASESTGKSGSADPEVADIEEERPAPPPESPEAE